VRAGQPDHLRQPPALDQSTGFGLADDAQRRGVPGGGERQRIGVERLGIARRGQDQARDLQRGGRLLGRGGW
jgi:hypothetical protein